MIDGIQIKRVWARFVRSVWLFPALLTLALAALTILQLSGSSIGIYHTYFYGDSPDPALIAGQPRSIRSDEWVVNTPMVIAQNSAGFSRINPHIGAGQDMSLVLDVPDRDWSELFKPHNLAFFVMPFDNAFAFRWWFMAYLLVLSCYFFILALLPKRRMVASLLSLSLLFMPFIQWWYLYGTLGSIYYSLFIATALMYFLRTKVLVRKLVLLGVISYLLVCLALILYPPFQIPCGLVLATFSVGYLAEEYLKTRDIRWLLKQVGMLSASVAVALTIVGLFVATRIDTVRTITSTAYPGHRTVSSGGYSPSHFFSGSLDGQLLSDNKGQYYQLPSIGATNQSEDAAFILLSPFLLLPTLYLLHQRQKYGKVRDYALTASTALFLIFVGWLFVPHIPVIGKVLLLDYVPLNRLIIGIGLLNIVLTVLFMRGWDLLPEKKPSRRVVLVYSLVAFVFLGAIHIYIAHRFPEFISYPKAILLACPVPLTTLLILYRRYALASVLFLCFSLFTSVSVNPLYQGTATLTNTPLTKAVHSIDTHDEGTWVTEPILLENIPQVSGADSITGVYSYPQLDLWQQTGSPSAIYNRYAHVGINFDRDANQAIPTQLALIGPDHFSIFTEPCSAFMHYEHIKYVLTDGTISAACLTKVQTVTYPAHTFYIYKLTH